MDGDVADSDPTLTFFTTPSTTATTSTYSQTSSQESSLFDIVSLGRGHHAGITRGIHTTSNVPQQQNTARQAIANSQQANVVSIPGRRKRAFNVTPTNNLSPLVRPGMIDTARHRTSTHVVILAALEKAEREAEVREQEAHQRRLDDAITAAILCASRNPRRCHGCRSALARRHYGQIHTADLSQCLSFQPDKRDPVAPTVQSNAVTANPPLPPDVNQRMQITFQDVMFVIENEGMEGARRRQRMDIVRQYIFIC
ncbi:hypothetical protein C8R45DRAFT_1106486 [Mycena sanguinolenta]|nr:hypothetical protein C8R45DRAFT_1106486 [Mycena sanguinolenta]